MGSPVDETGLFVEEQHPYIYVDPPESRSPNIPEASLELVRRCVYLLGHRIGRIGRY